jgi:hypothetical protein
MPGHLQGRAARRAALPSTSLLNKGLSHRYGVGRGCGVGRGRGVGVGLGVGELGVGVGVAVGGGVGVGVGPQGLMGQLKISIVAMMVAPSLA